MANKGDIYKVALPNGDEYNFKDKYVRENYRALNNNDFDTINVTELNSGNLINTGAARFLNTINGSVSGTSSNVTGTVAIANGGTGATTRLSAAQNLTNEAVTSPTHIVGLTTNWGKFGYTTITQLKSAMSLNNVENKSSATIRGELTSANVTTALGYTPVNKAGDTMSGALHVSNTGKLIFDWTTNTDCAMFVLKDAEQYGIRYKEGDTDKMKFSASGNANTDNADLCINGAGDGTVTIRGNTILHAGNYTSYTVKKDGTGASGTWEINISGNAATASKLGTSNVGSATNPIYLSAGVATACTYSLNKSVPSDALFTDANVTQTATSTNANYEILFSGTADNTTRTEGVRKTNSFIYNPNSKTLTLDGTFIIKGQASDKRFKTRGIVGIAQDASALDALYLQHSNDTNDTVYFGASAGGSISSNGTQYSGNAATATTATTATKLGTSTVGGTTTPIYLNAGVPTALSYTIAKSVPSDALFTDHTYNFSGATFYSGNQNNSEHNANNIQYNGLYYYTSNGPSKSLGATSDDAAIFAQAYSTSWVSQIASDYRNGNLYTRGKNNGTWQRWRKVRYSDDQFEHSDTVYFDSTTSKIAVNKSTSAWDAQAYSTDGYVDNIMLSFKPNQTNMAMMIGFDSNPSQDAGYTNIDYCWYVHNDAKLTMFESGTEISSISGHTTYVVGDELRVEYSGGYIRYYHNGVLCREVSRAISGKLYFDSSFHGKTSCIYDITFGVATRNATYAASAEKATKDSDGNTINSTYLKLSGGTMTGQIKTSFKEAVATGSRQSDATTITDLIADVRYSSGCCGSVSIDTTYTLNNITIPTGWYNYVWIPHRSGGINGAADNDNCEYGVLYISHMITPSKGTYEISFGGSNILKIRMIASFTATPTTGKVVITDGTGGDIKASGYTIAKSVPSDAVFTDQNVSQSATTTSNWRKIVLSYQDSASAGASVTTNTNVVYVTPNAEIQPSTGTIRSAGHMIATVFGVNQSNGTGGGISLYQGAGYEVKYGVAFRTTANQGKHGYVQSDWATYFTMDGADTRGWVFKNAASGKGNVASISSAGNMVLNGSLTVGGNIGNTSGVRQVYNATTQSLDFVFVA